MMHGKEPLFKSLQAIIRGAKVLEIPIILTEQAPEKIGTTVPEISQLLTGLEPISKTTFSCCQNQKFAQTLGALKREQILIAGIETHVCVYQTTADLINSGYYVQVIADAVSSRSLENKQIGLERIKAVGGNLTGVETVLCELTRSANHPKFKEILGLMKA